ncbi:efflux RND transporter permease subunit [Aliikangiella coralliicola]|uniref:MMPL family transporter n=1 Tax=Aliikangiella coralliicola TaxID=2592383 RepID=A0A545UK35_9GAMM|nr:MMPL family transporter [Aliikangiella coralliicola]TQV89824.1 MMPL family transporter [Aliikangiella coralliicola]
MSATLANLVIRYRWLLLILALLTIGAAGYGGSKLGFTTDYRVFFDEGNEQLEAYEALQNTYEKSDNVLFVLKPKQGDIFNKETIKAIQWLTNESWQTPFSTRVDSIANYQHTKAEEDDLIVADLAGEELELTPTEIDYIKNVALNEPLLVHRLVSESGHVGAVNVTVKLPGIEMDENNRVATFSADLKQQLEQKFPHLEVYMTGFVMLNEAFQVASQQDMATIVPLMFMVVLLTLGFLLRSVTATFATLVMIIASIVTAMGITGWLGIKLTPPSSSAPTIIMTMAVADAVHVLVTFLQQYHRGLNKFEAMRESLRVNFQPIFLTSVTTVIGFLSMNFSEVPPFHDLGNIVAMGVTAAFLFSVTLLPAMVLALPIKQKIIPADKEQGMDKLANFVINNRKNLLWSMTIFTLVTVAFLPKNELNDEWVQYFDKSVQFRTDTDFVLENLTGLYTLEFSLKAGGEGSVSDPKFLKMVEEFSDMAESQPEVIHVNTFTDTMSRLNKNMHGDNPEYYRLPQERELAAQYLLLYEMSLPYGLDLNNQINVKKSSTRVVVTAKNLSTKETIALENRLGAWLVVNGKDFDFDVASPSLMFAHIGERNIVSMLGGTAIALVMISILLIFAMRSFKMGLVSLVPNLVPAIIAFGIWGIFVSQVGMSLAMVAGMTLGIVVDDTVHFLSKYLRAREEKGLSATEAVRYAFANVGKALVTTTIVLGAGFSVMTFSSFSLNSDMGVMTALTITVALLIDFLLLPALLLTYEKEKRNVQEPNRLATESNISTAN